MPAVQIFEFGDITDTAVAQIPVWAALPKQSQKNIQFASAASHYPMQTSFISSMQII